MGRVMAILANTYSTAGRDRALPINRYQAYDIASDNITCPVIL